MSNKFNLGAFQLTDERSDLVKLARLAETAERYEDMCTIIKQLVKNYGLKSDLTVEERNLLSVGYKNVIGSRRASWRTLNVDEHKDDALAATYKKQVEAELEAICQDVLALLADNLVPATSKKANEAEVFYLKMAGDYYRYLAELISDKGYSDKSAEYYERAFTVATGCLAPTHPIRLGLALNFSVCHYEIRKDAAKAIEMARTAFDNAISKLDQLDEASYKDSTLIMQLLRDNITLWTSDQNAEAEEEAGGE